MILKDKRTVDKIQILTFFVFSLLAALSFEMNRKIVPVAESFRWDPMYYIIAIPIAMYFAIKAFSKPLPRGKIASIVLAALITLLNMVGFVIKQYNDLSPLWSSPGQIGKHLVYFLGNSFMLLCLFRIGFAFLFRGTAETKLISPRPTPRNRSFFVYWISLLLLWIPYLLAYFPGIVNPDGRNQIMQCIGQLPYANLNPMAHTLFIKLCLTIAAWFGAKDTNAGVAIFSIFQMLFVAGVFSFCLWYLEKRMLPTWAVKAVWLFYALFPPFAIYSIGIFKDVPFACFLAILTLCIWEMVSSESVLPRKLLMPVLILSLFGIAFVRNGAIYILLVIIPLVAIFCKPFRKLLLISLGMVVISYMLFTGPVFQWLNVSQSNTTRESLSVPLQQLARVVKDHGNELAQSDSVLIENLLPVKEGSLADVYDPRYADPVKNRFQESFYSKNRQTIASMWLRLLIRYPKSYANAFLCENFGYWYPDENYTVHTMLDGEGISLSEHSLWPQAKAFIDNQLLPSRVWPVVSMVYSIGMQFLLLLFSGVLVGVKKRWKYLLPFAPVLALWIGCMFSPVHAELRYAFGLFVISPLLGLLAMQLRFENSNSGQKPATQLK